MQNHRENLLLNADRIKNGKILNDEIFQFYSDLFDFQYRKECAFKELNSFPAGNVSNFFTADAGLPGIPDHAIEELSRSLDELTVILKKYNPGLETESAVRDLASDRVSVEKAIGMVLNKDSEEIAAASRTARIGFEEYIFLVINWLRPYFVSYRGKFPDADKERYGDRNCPFCGYYPDMSVLSAEKEGRRFLRCGLCENMWPFKRISCAICGNEDSKQLEYFTDEKEDRYRLDVCNSCGGYIKTVRLNKSEEIENCDLTVENMLSAPLEGLLMQKGFKRL